MVVFGEESELQRIIDNMDIASSQLSDMSANQVITTDTLNAVTLKSISSDSLVGRNGSTALASVSMSDLRSMLGYRVIVKPGDETKVTDTTLADDDTLVLSVAANTNYRVHCNIPYDSNATADLKIAFTIPSGVIGLAIHGGPDSGATSRIHNWYGASGAALTIGTGGAEEWLWCDGIIEIAGTGGNFAFQWAQNTSTGSTTVVKATAHMELSIYD